MRGLHGRTVKTIAILAIAASLLPACGGNGTGGQDAGSPAGSPAATNGAAQEETGNPEATASPAPTEGAEQTAPPAGTGEKGAIAGISASDAAVNILFALRQQDMKQFAGYVHPKKGVLFYPSASIDKDKAATFQASKLPSLSDGEARAWGTDSAGKAVKLTFADYYKQYIYDRDYATVEQIGKNELLGPNKDKSNIAELFPDASFFDYYYSEGSAWSSLVLVLEHSGDTWYLTGVIHDAGKQ